ncbi:hypothetical protein D0Q02_08830 [Micromonospora craniellae]|uniref:Uncharacterized protein n=1 Tax=Micromonospora craniellae TaxID=2294034 RepID=A0A372G1W6_9ACTN|nr:hypothetical protein D0Q02_08830 [Micromonospora craniellae]
MDGQTHHRPAPQGGGDQDVYRFVDTDLADSERRGGTAARDRRAGWEHQPRRAAAGTVRYRELGVDVDVPEERSPGLAAQARYG